MAEKNDEINPNFPKEWETARTLLWMHIHWCTPQQQSRRSEKFISQKQHINSTISNTSTITGNRLEIRLYRSYDENNTHKKQSWRFLTTSFDVVAERICAV